MSDENEFLRALNNAGNYSNVHIEFEISHPTEPGREITIDNVGQRGNTTFIFEGKKGNLDDALNQLERDYKALKLFRDFVIKSGRLRPYANIRLFYYSFKRGLLIEYNSLKRELNQYRFDKRNINQLVEILRKL